MGMGLYGGEKIKRLTRERIFKNNSHYKLLAPFNSGCYTWFFTIKAKKLKNIKELDSSDSL